jgi:hypothetical protein
MSGVRPGSHRIGDLAEAHLTQLLKSEGWLVDPVILDYEEDFVVQIVQGEVVIPSRFYIQCKGTTGLMKRIERGACRFQTESLIRCPPRSRRAEDDGRDRSGRKG